jgi:VWFA-related protein
LRRSYPQITLILLLTLCLFAASPAQKPVKRKKLKDFGSSLKRLKWNSEKKAAVELPAGAGTSSDSDDVIRIDTSLVSCELLVLDKSGKAINGLTAEDFSITEDDTAQTVGHFFTGDNINVPRTIVLIIDYSGSQKPYIKNSVAAAKVLVDKLGPKDLMAIVTDDVELIHDFTSDKKELKQKLDWLQQQTEVHLEGTSMRWAHFGRSKQYSALMATLNEAFEDSDIRPIIIFQTDGDQAVFLRNPVVRMTLPEGLEGDALEKAQKEIELYKRDFQNNVTEFSLDDLYRAVERSRATVYTVIPGIKLLGLTPEKQLEKAYTALQWQQFESINEQPMERRQEYKENLKKEQKDFDFISFRAQVERTVKMQEALSGVAGLTGGWTEFLQRPQQADEIYTRIFSDINQRYIVGYYPTNKERDGKRRKIDFAVKGHPEYQIYGRRSYFAPSQ